MSRVSAVNTSNYMYIGSSAGTDQLATPMNGASGCTAHAMVRVNDLSTQAFFQGWIGGNVVGYMQLAIVSNLFRVNGRSAIADGGGVSVSSVIKPVIGNWYALGGINDFAKKIQSIFVNGVNRGTSAGITGWASTTYANSGAITLPAQIGASGIPPANQCNALVSDVALWKVALSHGEMQALGAGINPLMIRPASLLFYAPLIGRTSPEPNFGSLGSTGDVTIVGTQLEGPPPPAFVPAMLDVLETDAINVSAAFKAAWARGANLPVLGTGTY